MYTYSQETGRLTQNGHYIGEGWAGQLAGKNNPGMQHVHNLGPLPQGKYKIGEAYQHPILGPLTMNLTPDPANEMFGRSEFRIHGASRTHPETSSHGCIIQGHNVRFGIALLSTDRDLEVVA